VKIIRPKTIQHGTLTEEDTGEITLEQTLADFPAKYAYFVLMALADEFSCEVVEQ